MDANKAQARGQALRAASSPSGVPSTNTSRIQERKDRIAGARDLEQRKLDSERINMPSAEEARLIEEEKELGLIPRTEEELAQNQIAEDNLSFDDDERAIAQEAVQEMGGLQISAPRVGGGDYGYGMQSRGIRQQAEAEADLANKQVSVYEQQQKMLDAQAAEQAEEMEKTRLATEKYQEDLNDITNEKAEFDFKKPDFWGDKSTGEKILTGVGLFLSALSPGGMDKALEIIDGQIERDLKLQERKYQQLSEKGVDVKNAYAMYRQQGMDRQQASDAYRLTVAKGLESKLLGYQAASGGRMSQARMNQMMGKLQEGRQALEEQMGLKQAELIQKQLKEQKESQSGMVNPATGYVGVLGDKVMYKDFITKASNTKSATKLLDQVIANSQDSKRLIPGTDEYALVNQGLNMLVGKLRESIAGPGVLSETDIDLIKNSIGDPSKVSSMIKKYKPQLSNIKRIINEDLDDYAEMAGLQSVKKMQNESVGFKPN